MATNKYSTSKHESEGDILPNKLGISTIHEIEKAEMEGFYVAYKLLFDELNSRTKFNLILVLIKFAKQNLIRTSYAVQSCIIAICGIVMLILKTTTLSNVYIIVCIGMALATTGYGIFRTTASNECQPLTKNMKNGG